MQQYHRKPKTETIHVRQQQMFAYLISVLSFYDFVWKNKWPAEKLLSS